MSLGFTYRSWHFRGINTLCSPFILSVPYDWWFCTFFSLLWHDYFLQHTWHCIPFAAYHRVIPTWCAPDAGTRQRTRERADLGGWSSWPGGGGCLGQLLSSSKCSAKQEMTYSTALHTELYNYHYMWRGNQWKIITYLAKTVSDSYKYRPQKQ